MRTRFRSISAASVAVLLGLSLVSAGCGQYSFASLKAKKAFKDANVKYSSQDWGEAAEKYEEVVASDPNFGAAYFFLANSYDNMYKPSREGEPENDAYMQKAIANYKIAAEKDENPEMRLLAMKYLVAAYGEGKLNQPDQAEPIVKQMIANDPNEVTNYFALAKIYQDAGNYDEAEQALLKAAEVKPSDPTVYTTLSGFYNDQGDFDKTIENLKKAADLTPNEPQGYHLIATFYEEKVRKDFRLPKAQKKDYAIAGIEAEDKALALNPQYVDAMVVKNILLRHQANAETDRSKQEALIKEADALRNKALELRKSTQSNSGQ
jgi:tetratricopeptide (TPR) repeat protein